MISDDATNLFIRFVHVRCCKALNEPYIEVVDDNEFAHAPKGI